jgi:hypothetical protein
LGGEVKYRVVCLKVLVVGPLSLVAEIHMFPPFFPVIGEVAVIGAEVLEIQQRGIIVSGRVGDRPEVIRMETEPSFLKSFPDEMHACVFGIEYHGGGGGG